MITTGPPPKFNDGRDILARGIGRTHRKVSAASVRPTLTPFQQSSSVVLASVVYHHRPLMAPQHEPVMRPGPDNSSSSGSSNTPSCSPIASRMRRIASSARDSGRMRAGGSGQRLGCSHTGYSRARAIARVLGAMHERTRPELVETAIR
jgi:hypothetical protein